MRKVWTVAVEGKDYEVDISWDTMASGGGRILIDGVETKKWYIGLKAPGAAHNFQIGDAPARIILRISEFDLFVRGKHVPGTRREPPQYPSRLPIVAVAVGIVLVGVIVVIILASI